MLLSYEGRAVDDSIEVIALSETEWKLRNGAVPADDASSVLAFIEKSGEGFSVLDLTVAPGTWGRFDCLAAAIAFISSHLPAQMA